MIDKNFYNWKIKKLGLIDTVYDIGDKADCSCSIGSPDGNT